MKILKLTWKELVEAWRNPALTLIYLFFPAVMVAIYYFSFGSGVAMSNMLVLMVENRDQGPYGTQLVENLKTAQYDGKPLFTVTVVQTTREAQFALEERKATLLLTIPEDFSAGLQENRVPAVIKVLSDPTYDMAIFTASFVDSAVSEFAQQFSNQPPIVSGNFEFIPNTGTLNDFQFGVPGTILFGVLFGIITSALVLVRETTTGTIQRLILANVRAGQLFIALILSQGILALIQLPITYVTALVFNFKSAGSIWITALICLVISLTATACGLLTACFSKNDGEATNLAMVFMVPLVFLSSAVFKMPAMPLFTIGNLTINFADLLPSTHAVEAMRRVLIFGDGLAAVSGRLLIALFQTGLLLFLGAWLFQRLRLRRIA